MNYHFHSSPFYQYNFFETSNESANADGQHKAQCERSERWVIANQINQAHEMGDRHQEEISMSQSYVNLLYHIIFSTKDREPIITEKYQPRLYEYIGGIVRKQGGIALAINGMEDHVHLFAKLR